MKEPHADVRGEYIDIAEGRISQTCDRTAVMQEFADLVPAFSHHLKPVMRDGSQFTGMLFHPRIDRGIALDSAVESEQFRHLHGSKFIIQNPRLLRAAMVDKRLLALPPICRLPRFARHWRLLARIDRKQCGRLLFCRPQLNSSLNHLRHCPAPLSTVFC